MAAKLPDDPVLEYDMLPLVINDDIISSSFLDVPTSSAASSHVEDVLVNCSVDVSIAVSTSSNAVATSSDLCSSSAGASGGAGCSSATAESVTNIPDEFTAFLLDNEQFLRDMEQVLQIEYDSENQKNQTTLEPKRSTIDFDAYNGLTMIPSPCPSVPSPSPCVLGVDEFEMESPLAEKKKKGLDEPTKKYHKSLPPLQLQHTDLSLCEASETSSLGHTDDSAFASPLYLMEEKTIKDCSEACEEDEMMEEKAMEDEIGLLEKEAKYLDAQVDFLQSRAKSNRPRRKNLKQRDTKQPKLLAKSQETNQLLTDLVAQQKVYQENFRAMLALAPVNEVRMALMSPMESYIRLGKDLNERRKTILSLREEKLDMTYKFIEQKASGLDIHEPYQFSDMFEKFGKHYCVNFAIFKYDGVSVFQVGRAIYEQIAGKDVTLNRVMGSTTICESFDTIKCNFIHQRIVSSMNWEGKDAEKMPDMESNAIFYCRFGDNLAVLSADYIDQDDLHPYDASNRIRRDMSSGVVLSGHTDANGKQFVVMKRYLMAKYHMYPHKMSQEQQDRFFTSIPKCSDTMKTLIFDSLQRNETSCSCAGDD